MTASSDPQRQMASLPIAIVVLEPGQKIANANPAAEQFLGQSARRLIGKNFHDIVTFTQAQIATRLADSDNPVSAREVTVTIAGVGTRQIDFIAAPISDEPGWQILSLLDSSTVEVRGGQGNGPDAALMRAPEVLAHEIKNPLAGIRGAAQLLGRKLDEEDQALTRLITAEVDRIAKLIDEMQSLSRKSTLPLEACNLHEVVRRASDILAVAGNTGVKIIEEFDPSLPPLLGNADALVQVLINLLVNAREACDDVKKPSVSVRTRFASGLQLHSTVSGKPVRLPIELRVSDNGPGVDQAMRDRIFDPFVTTKKSGHGLGLALVRKLVNEMNGRIVYDRDEDAGLTHFRLHLPMASSKESADMQKGFTK